MSAAIHPDGSVVLRAGARVVRIDAPRREIIVRAAMEGHEHGGTVLSTFPCRVAERVRIVPGKDDGHHLFLDLVGNRKIELGESPSQGFAMQIALAVADIAEVEVWMEETAPEPAAHFTEEPTTPIPHPAVDPTAEAPTDIPGTEGGDRLSQIAAELAATRATEASEPHDTRVEAPREPEPITRPEIAADDGSTAILPRRNRLEMLAS